MLKILPRHFCLFAAIFFGLLTVIPEVPASDRTIAVVVSRKIRPYVQVTDGILDQVSQKAGTAASADVFFLSPGDDTVTAQVVDRLMGGGYDLAAAVGPEAAALVWDIGFPGKKMYAALLDPDAVFPMPEDACGISLRIPVPVQVGTLAGTFPSLKKIGLLFDPNHNQWFLDGAVSTRNMQQATFEIIPMPVTNRNQISQVLTDHLGQIDAVWMIPDQTVISEKLIQHVIKQAFYANAGVIGYNAYFTRVGALFSFEFDYRALGRQAGDTIVDFLAGGDCRGIPPVFDIRINEKVLEKLGLRVEETP